MIRGDIINTSKRLAALAGAAAVVALLAGCDPDTTGATPVATPSAVVTSTPVAGQQGSASGGGVNLTLSVPGSTALKLDGAAIAFDFTIANPSATAAAQPIGIVASMGHCSCSSGGAKMSPKGAMQLLDASTGTWKPVTFVREGTGMDYLSIPVIPSVTLAPGQSTTYHMKVQLYTDPQETYTAGTSTITVNLKVPDSLQSLASANVPVTVAP
ncbi:hypothetical protein [Nocardia sp. NPDC004722]